MDEVTTEAGERLPWKRAAKKWRSMYRLYSRQESRRFEAYRLAGVGMMIGTMPNGDERVTISVPGEEKRRAIKAEAVHIALTELRGEVEALPAQVVDRRPEDDADCDRLGCEDRTHLVERPGFSRAAVIALIDKRLEETK
jgi:hypothetical protein